MHGKGRGWETEKWEGRRRTRGRQIQGEHGGGGVGAMRGRVVQGFYECLYRLTLEWYRRNLEAGIWVDKCV